MSRNARPRSPAVTIARPTLTANLDTHAAAEVLSVSPRTLQRWRQEGRGPRFAKLGGAVRYPLTELERFAAESMRDSTAEGTP
jgi:hypothetical protein